MKKNNILSRTSPQIIEVLEGKKIFIAGAGGLGSNVALNLIRSGAKNLTIADYDIIEESNLNRQFFFLEQVGKLKSDCLSQNLKKIIPDIEVNVINKQLTSDNFSKYITTEYDIVFECFDSASSKAELIEFVLTTLNKTPIIGVSGISELSDYTSIKVKKFTENLTIVGDFGSSLPNDKTLSPIKVNLIASIQAEVGINIIKNMK
jgi:sulfur carrier protein ThiS adenylyltransferase